MESHPWTYDEVVSVASKYKSISQWMDGNRGSYYAAIRNNWLDDIRLKVFNKKPRKPRNYWSYKKVVTTAKSFESFSAWKYSYPGAVNAALRYGWINEIQKYFHSKEPSV